MAKVGELEQIVQMARLVETMVVVVAQVPQIPQEEGAQVASPLCLHLQSYLDQLSLAT